MLNLDRQRIYCNCSNAWKIVYRHWSQFVKNETGNMHFILNTIKNAFVINFTEVDDFSMPILSNTDLS